MTEESLIAFLNMQYVLISNPIKKMQLLSFMDNICEQRIEKRLEDRNEYTIISYLEEQMKKEKNTFKQRWLQICLSLFQELESNATKKKTE